MAKQIITMLKLNEISGVDRPAQPKATFVIAKRAPSPQPDPGPQETTMYKTRAELLAAIAKFDAATSPAAELVNITKSAVALKAEADLPKTITDLMPVVEKKAGDPDPAVTALQEQVEELTKKAGMTPQERDLYDKMDAAGKKAHLAKSDAERAEAVEKAFQTDPVVYTTLDGVDITKSAGSVTLALAKKLDEQTRELAKANAKAADTDLTKRAETDLEHLGGDLDTRKALLKSVDGITDQKVRDEVLKTLRSADAAVAGAFNKRGSTGGGPIAKSADPEQALEDLAKAYAKDNKVDFTKAYSAVLDTDEGKALYEQSLEA